MAVNLSRSRGIDRVTSQLRHSRSGLWFIWCSSLFCRPRSVAAFIEPCPRCILGPDGVRVVASVIDEERECVVQPISKERSHPRLRLAGCGEMLLG
jgi:hypothetical protein